MQRLRLGNAAVSHAYGRMWCKTQLLLQVCDTAAGAIVRE